ncbi:MAG: glycosyl transferase group 1 [Nocardioides sp.]|nr:glycosyl transferase group 1 [Nocardioides sp.]
MGGRTRILFLNQGQPVKKSPLGNLRAQQVYQSHFPPGASAVARFRVMEPFNLVQRAAVTPVPGLPGRGYSDLRWFALQSFAARRIIHEEIRSWNPTVAHVVVNGAALLLPAVQPELPCVPAFDVAMAEWMRLMHRSPQDQPLAHPWRVLQELERRSLEAAPLAISWTEHVSYMLRGLVPGARIETLHPGLDTHVFSPRVGARGPGVLRILFVGGRFAAKGGPALLSAAEGLARPVEVHVVTTERVQPHPLMTVHRARPGTTDLADLFRDADLFCLPTTWDAVPWAILEAQASGLPVVSTSVGSIPELVGADCGRVVPPNDPAALREALADVVDDERSLRALGERARAQVEVKYDADRNTPRLVELLSSVAA